MRSLKILYHHWPTYPLGEKPPLASLRRHRCSHNTQQHKNDEGLHFDTLGFGGREGFGAEVWNKIHVNKRNNGWPAEDLFRLRLRLSSLQNWGTLFVQKKLERLNCLLGLQSLFVSLLLKLRIKFIFRSSVALIYGWFRPVLVLVAFFQNELNKNSWTGWYYILCRNWHQTDAHYWFKDLVTWKTSPCCI